jgi:hypothetical protein
MMSPEQYWIARALCQEGSRKATHERWRLEAHHVAHPGLPDWVRGAIGDWLIAWGLRVRPHPQPRAAHR